MIVKKNTYPPSKLKGSKKLKLTQLFYLVLVVFWLLNLMSCTENGSDNKSVNTNAQKQESPLVTYKIVSISASKYGYQILRNGQVYIQQLTIPAVTGKQFFKTKQEAETLANFVVTKIKSGNIPPTVTLNDLDSLNISIEKSNSNSF